MQVSDIADQIRTHLLDGETLTEEPSDYFGDRMLTITTQAATAHAYIIDDMYALAALDGVEAWRPGDEAADNAIAAVLDYARRNGKPAPPPNPNEVFADAITYLTPLLREGEAISTGIGRNGDPLLHIAGDADPAVIQWNGGRLCYTRNYDPGYIWAADGKEEEGQLLRAALSDARNPIDFDTLPHGNR